MRQTWLLEIKRPDSRGSLRQQEERIEENPDHAEHRFCIDCRERSRTTTMTTTSTTTTTLQHEVLSGSTLQRDARERRTSRPLAPEMKT